MDDNKKLLETAKQLRKAADFLEYAANANDEDASDTALAKFLITMAKIQEIGI